ncbi:MAG: GFA family protein [Gammaproteobacteria bacterium]|nr:GFA family protein [Gammaproteobacteria bacterium]
METFRGSCHCGAIHFEIDVERVLENLRRCNCSLCKRKGSIMCCVPMSQFRLIKGEQDLSAYKWNTMVAEHYFCSHCGIYTHHRRRLAPDEYGFNIACLEDVDPFSYKDVAVFDGKSLD